MYELIFWGISQDVFLPRLLLELLLSARTYGLHGQPAALASLVWVPRRVFSLALQTVPF